MSRGVLDKQALDRQALDRQVFDQRQVRTHFGRAAASYDGAAALQREIGVRLLELLDHYSDPSRHGRAPTRVLDLGSGTGHAARAIRAHWPTAEVLMLDHALPMLREARRRRGWREHLRARLPAVCADACALPLADASVDVVFSNLCVQWVEDLPALLAELRRVLRPGGLLLLSSFGEATLHELRAAFATADDHPHVSPFASLAMLGDALVAAGFDDPVLERDVHDQRVADLAALMRHLRALGATNALRQRRGSLTGRARFVRAEAAYRALAVEAGIGEGLPVSWETLLAMAWAPPPGTPIRRDGMDEVRVPVTAIPVRRRPA